MIYGYARVSSDGQSRYGTSLEDQVGVLKQSGAIKVYTDTYTGTKMHRPQFDMMLSELAPGDTIIVTKLDRLGRTSEGIISLIKELIDKDITVKVLNMGTIENTPVGRLIVTFLAGIAEFERDLIVERTNAGKAYKKQNDPDWKDGRKPLEYDESVFNDLYSKVMIGEMTSTEAYKTMNIGKTKWYQLVKERKSA